MNSSKARIFKATVDRYNSKYLNISFLPAMKQKDNGKKIIKNIHRIFIKTFKEIFRFNKRK